MTAPGLTYWRCPECGTWRVTWPFWAWFAKPGSAVSREVAMERAEALVEAHEAEHLGRRG